MAAEFAFFAVFLLLALVAPFVLYAFIREETSDAETMDRADAERAAREESRRRRR